MPSPFTSSTVVRSAAALALSASVLAGCAGDPGPRTAQGAVGGALVGGAIGALTGGGTGNIVAGAIAGGLVGGVLGNALDEEDRRRAYAAEMQALEYGGPGTPVSWQGQQGARGTIVPGPYHSRGAHQRCRDYSHTIYIQGRPEVARGVACRNPDGTWSQIS
jgi:surface antigen